MSESAKGRCASEETKRKMSLALKGSDSPMKGKHLSEEAKAKISLANKGKHLSEEAKAKIGLANKGENSSMWGKTLSEEARQRIRLFRIGKQHSDETRKKISLATKEKPKSEEHRHNISLGQKGENNHNWNGGSSLFHYPLEWTEDLKKSIRDRDSNECQNPDCDHKSTKLDVHHVDYDKQNCSWFNLITLCSSHHVRTNYNREYWRGFYSKIISDKYYLEVPKKKGFSYTLGGEVPDFKQFNQYEEKGVESCLIR
jgi:hypothetical protein